VKNVKTKAVEIANDLRQNSGQGTPEFADKTGNSFEQICVFSDKVYNAFRNFFHNVNDIVVSFFWQPS